MLCNGILGRFHTDFFGGSYALWARPFLFTLILNPVNMSQIVRAIFLLFLPVATFAEDFSTQADSLRKAVARDAEAGERASAISKLEALIDAEAARAEDYVLLGQLLFARGRAPEALDVLQALSVLRKAEEPAPFLEAARIENVAQETELVERLFERYIEHLPEKEREIYQDIRRVVTDEEREVYESIVETTSGELAGRYWNFRDPTPLTPENEHRLEYYRRVVHAREHFSGRFPWDDRGEVYLRLGAPDHVSRSSDIQAELDRTVQDARTNFANRLRVRPEAVPGHPIFPIRDDVKWEYWVYTDLGGGTEFTFVNAFGRDLFIFAPIPTRVSLSTIRELQKFHGRELIENATAHRQVIHDESVTGLPIDFYYYTAGFRGKGGKTRLEIYYGLPASEMARLQMDETSDLLVLDRGLALFNASWEEVHRVKDQLAFEAPTGQQILEGAFIPGELAVELAPGRYHLAFQVFDVLSGRSRAYREVLTLDDYAKNDTLKISDIEVAFSIAEAEEAGPFVKRQLKIIPMSSGSFRRHQHAFVYFEIYDLKRDAFGQTRYRVTYSVRSLGKSSPARILRGLGELFRRSEKGREIEVAYDQVGNSSDDAIFLELDLSETQPGRQAVDATVTDLLTGQSVSKEIIFKIEAYE